MPPPHKHGSESPRDDGPLRLAPEPGHGIKPHTRQDAGIVLYRLCDALEFRFFKKLRSPVRQISRRPFERLMRTKPRLFSSIESGPS